MLPVVPRRRFQCGSALPAKFPEEKSNGFFPKCLEKIRHFRGEIRFLLSSFQMPGGRPPSATLQTFDIEGQTFDIGI
jgi:hypothetical protein